MFRTTHQESVRHRLGCALSPSRDHMTYTPQDAQNLTTECEKIMVALNKLLEQCVIHGRLQDNSRAKEYLTHGVARRLEVLRRCVRNIFELFPPSQKQKLESGTLLDVQNNLHTFLINLSGVWDNFAWAFVLRHGLEAEIGGRQNVGLFFKKTQKFMPPVLKNYLKTEPIRTWQERYLSNYRDALAHRIPPYIPPIYLSADEDVQYQNLLAQEVEYTLSGQQQRLEEVRAKLEVFGRPCFEFLHSFSPEEAASSIALHAQLISDAKTVVEFGNMFLKGWHEREYPPVVVKSWWRRRLKIMLRTLTRKIARLDSKL